MPTPKIPAGKVRKEVWIDKEAIPAIAALGKASGRKLKAQLEYMIHNPPKPKKVKS